MLSCSLASGAAPIVGVGSNRFATVATKRRIGQAAYWQDVFGDPAALPGSFNDLFTAASDYAKNESSKPIRLYMWCGTEDSLLPGNHALRDHLLALGYDLTYAESAGNHAWQWWDLHIQDVLRWLFPQTEVK